MKSRLSRKSLVALTVLLTTVGILLYANLRNPQKKLDYEIEATGNIHSEHFETLLGQLMGPVLSEGNQVQVLNNGDEIFPAMLKAIKAAQHSICFESYIYWSGKVGQDFAHALSERARNKVSVHLLIDWVGSQKIDERFIDEMKKAGVEVEYYRPLRWYNVSRMNNRTHRKILVVDGKIGFTGGVGIADEWAGDGLQKNKWRDTHYKATGPVVAQMQSTFMDNWLKIHPEVHSSRKYFPKLEATGTSKAQMFRSSSQEGASSVRMMYMLALAASRHSILLENAYFVPDEATIQEIIKARNRGVRVQIITPKYTDNGFVRHASRQLWGPLLKAGVEFFEYRPALFHPKVLIVDEYFVSIGSTNFDERSFRLNDEANLNVLDKEFALEQVRIFEKDRSLSEPISYEKWHSRPWQEKLLEHISLPLRTQL